VAVRRLSAGQRRRTALAALVARQPELWLLDEPHAGLDAEYRDLLDGVIREAAAGGAAVVIASHERERASALADRVLTMAGGIVVAGGPAEGPGARSVDAPSPPVGAGEEGRGIFPARDLEAAHVA